jgi:hypothetical protein
MMAVYLLDDDIIDGALHAAGELVAVPDDYDPDNIARIVRRNLEQNAQTAVDDRQKRIAQRKFEKRFQTGLQRLRTILQADYPVFWNKLSNRPVLLQKIIDEMREDVSILQRALADPQWFVDEVTKRFN